MKKNFEFVAVGKTYLDERGNPVYILELDDCIYYPEYVYRGSNNKIYRSDGTVRAVFKSLFNLVELVQD